MRELIDLAWVSCKPWGSAGQSDSELFIHLTTYCAGAVQWRKRGLQLLHSKLIVVSI